MERVLVTIIFLGLAGAAAFYMRYGTLDPCSAVRLTAREGLARSSSGLDRAAAAALPDFLVTGLLERQYGPLTPGRCVGILVDQAQR